MSTEEIPHICECGFCEQGLLRFRSCPECEAVCAICDECELIWEDVSEVSDDPSIKASCAFPRCPACGAREKGWPVLSVEEIQDAELEDYISDKSV
ncbi:MAG: hypothetical protein H8E66_01605 [Planctomycetes bacterium]|nr:hypothetical protein [Planctomycetota bacterium]